MKSLEHTITEMLKGKIGQKGSYNSLNTTARKVMDTKNRFVPPTLAEPSANTSLDKEDIEKIRNAKLQNKYKIIDNP